MLRRQEYIVFKLLRQHTCPTFSATGVRGVSVGAERIAINEDERDGVDGLFFGETSRYMERDGVKQCLMRLY